MVKGSKKGGKNKKKGKRDRSRVQHQRLVTRTEDQQYGVITKMLGDCRVHLRYINEKGKMVETMGIIRGKLRKRVWMRVEDVVLVAQRDYDERVDIIAKYSDEEVRKLKRRGEINKLLLDGIGESVTEVKEGSDGEDGGFDFDYGVEKDATECVEKAKHVTEILNDVDMLNDVEDDDDFNWDEL